MATFAFTNLKDAARAMARDGRARERRVRDAVKKAARTTARFIITDTVPKAFGELSNSIHVIDGPRGNADIVADAPHAGAVENGSRPHTPPLAPLIAWVKLRGMQGITATGRIKKNRDRYGLIRNWRLEAARVIALSLKNKQRGGALSVDAPTEIARAIQQSIRLHGTKPHKFMYQGVHVAESSLDQYVNAALPDR